MHIYHGRATIHSWLSNRLSWYKRWHTVPHHRFIHWAIFSAASATAGFKILIAVLALASIALFPSYNLKASNQTWNSQAQWNNWANNGTATNITPDSLTLASSGTTWNIVATPTAEALHSIWGTDNSNIWAVGENGTIIHYDGVTWNTVASPTASNLYGIWGTDATHIWAVGGFNNSSSATILFYNGSSWDIQSNTVQDDLYAIWGSSSVDVWATGGYNFHPVSGHYSSSWVETIDWQIAGRGLWGTNSSNIWAVGNTGRITHYDGNDWGIVSSGLSEDLSGIWGANSSNIWTVGTNGLIAQYDGVNWNTITNIGSTTLRSIWGVSNTEIYTVGANGTIAQYDGSSWQTVTSPVVDELFSVWGSGSNDVWAVGANGTIIHTGPAYVSSGYATLVFTPQAGQLQDWDSVVIDQTTNGQAIETTFSNDTTCSSGFTTDLTALNNSENICIKVNLSTTDPTVTPEINALSLTYNLVPITTNDNTNSEQNDDNSSNSPNPVDNTTATPSPNNTIEPTPTVTITAITKESSSPSPLAASPEPTDTAIPTSSSIACETTASCQTEEEIITTNIQTSPNANSPLPTYLEHAKSQPSLSRTALITSTLIVGIVAADSILPLIDYLLINTPSFFSSLWMQIITWFSGYKKRRHWGIVRDSLTGMPLAQATVQLFVRSTNNETHSVDTMVTDKTGRFGFLATYGTYFVTAQKSGFLYPTNRIPSSYKGADFVVNESEVINLEVYLDRKYVHFTGIYIIHLIQIALDWLRLPLLITGSIITVYANIAYPFSLFNMLILFAYVLLWILLLMDLYKSRNTILLTDEHDRPLPFSLIRIIHGTTGQIVQHKVTDKNGEIYLLLPAGRYILVVPSPRNPKGSTYIIDLPEGIIPRHRRVKITF